MVDEPKVPELRRAHLRRGGAQRENALNGRWVFPVGDEVLRRSAVRAVREDHRVAAAQRAARDPPLAWRSGLSLRGKAERESARRAMRGTGKLLLSLRRARRGERGAHPGHHAGGRALRRGGADAALLCGASERAMQRAGQQAVVQL